MTENKPPYKVDVKVKVLINQEEFNGKVPVFREGMEPGQLYEAVLTFSYSSRPADHIITLAMMDTESELRKQFLTIEGTVVKEGWEEGTKPVHTYYLTQRPPGPGTYPVHTSTDPEDLRIEAYGNREVYKLSYTEHLTQKEVARYELLPALPDSVRVGSYYPISFAGSKGNLRVEAISEDRTSVTVWEDWEGQELPIERNIYNVNGLLNEYPEIFFKLVYPYEHSELLGK